MLRTEKRHSFLHYIFNGCQINLAVALDFTASNRYPDDPSSLHTKNLDRNQYYQALKQVGDIV